MRTLVFGKNGQVAQGLSQYFPEAVFLPRDIANLEQPSELTSILNHYSPKIVINAAAYTDVDRAETEPDRAMLINSEAPKIMAQWCAQRQSSLIHYSSDYVYDGSGAVPWKESDHTDPPNQYGLSKLCGEREIISTGCHSIILRTSWVFSPTGRNFVKTMLRIGREQESIKVVNDQIGAPTYAPDLAKATAQIISSPLFKNHHGIYNLSNSGQTSWYDFALSIFSIAKTHGFDLRVKSIQPIPSSEYLTPAKRPFNSRLDLRKIKLDFGIKMRNWSEALIDCVPLLMN